MEVSASTTWVRGCLPCPSPSTPGCGGSQCGEGEYRANLSCTWTAGHETDQVLLGTFNLIDYEDAEISYDIEGADFLQEVLLYCTAPGYASRNLSDFTDKPPVTVYLEFRFVWGGGANPGTPGVGMDECPGAIARVKVRNIEIRARR
jgi:hypothetical protein